ncbi:MAG: hypothetical protein EBZ75_14605, partial [Oxalobacteraceae bacterium]|nr:hypothetical protein [Oxalobacteraceae bacterium]
MPINPAIALGVRSLELPDPLAQYGKIAAIQQAQNQNALAQYQLGAAQREEVAQNALSRAYQEAYNPQTGAYDINKLRGAIISAGAGARLPGIEKQMGELRTQQLAQSEAESKLVDAKLKQARAFLDTVDPSDPNAPAQYIAWHEANHRDPVLGPILAARGVTADQSRARIAQAIQQGPQAFAQLLTQSKLGTERFIELNKPTFTTQDLGGTTRIVATPGLGGPSAVVSGSEATKTLTPGESKPTITQVDVGNEVITQSYDPVTRQVTVLERRAKGLTPGETKPTITQVDVGNEVITQMFDPKTNQISVLGRRPKAPTPDQQRQIDQERSVVAREITDERGNVTLLNKFGEVIQPRGAGGAPTTLRREQKPVIQNIDSGNMIITQMVDPNTGAIT